MVWSRTPRHLRLVPYVESLWFAEGEVPHRYERVLPNGRMQLLVNLATDELTDWELDGRVANQARGLALQGPRFAPRLIETAHQRRLCGVSFCVGGTWPLLRHSAGLLRDRVVDLNDVWGPSTASLRERLLEVPTNEARLDLLEAVLLERLEARPPAGRSLVEAARPLLLEGRSVREVSEGLGVSSARLRRYFLDEVGAGPKRWARLARFERALVDSMAGGSWADVAARHGFADQAHLVREFQTFGGASPTKLRVRGPETLWHVPLAT
jgi:AraC-like DNA-binding protein